MKRVISVVIAVIVITLSVLGVIWLYKQETKEAAPVAQGVNPDLLDSLPLAFQENRGQVDSVVKYLVKNQAQTIFFAPDHIFYALSRTIPTENLEEEQPGPPTTDAVKKETLAIKQLFVGAQANPVIIGDGQLPGVVNYLIGNDPGKWQKNVPTFAQIKYTQIYDGIDLVYSGDGGSLKYDYFIAPGKDASQIQIAFEGLDGLEIAEDGSLALVSSFGHIGLKAPTAYQMIDGEKRVVQVRYELRGDLVYGFTVEAYDKGYELVIDPRFFYSTYLGGSANDIAYGIDVDASGNAYIVGETASGNWVGVAGYFDATYGGGNQDAFVVKINPTASAPVIYSTYLGGEKTDRAYDVKVNAAGEAVVVGFTNSADYPTTLGALDTMLGGANTDGFVTKVSADGTSLEVSTYFGGLNPEAIFALDLDASENIYITGFTLSDEDPFFEFPVTPGAYDVEYGGNNEEDVFVAKLNSSASSVIFATYFGGPGEEVAYGISVDSSNEIYIVGESHDSVFPTTAGAYMTATDNVRETFIAKFNSTGSSLLYSSAFGANTLDFMEANAIVATDTDQAVIVGSVSVSGLPTKNAYDAVFDGTSDGFIAKFDTSLSGDASLVFSTLVGGTAGESFGGVTLDASGNIYAVGASTSDDYPFTADAIKNNYAAADDMVLSKFSSDGSQLLYSSYYNMSGGFGGDVATDVFVDDDENAYVVGYVGSSGMATSGVVQTTNQGVLDAIVFKTSTTNEAPLIPVLSSPLNGATVISVTPQLVAQYRDLDVGDPGVVHFRVSTGTTTDCVNNTAIVFSGTSGSVNNGVTGSVTTSTLTDGIAYAWCAQNDDGVLTSAFAAMGTFTVNLGTVVTYGTYLGGTGTDRGRGIGFDTSGNPVVIGTTTSSNYPTLNALQATLATGEDIFITKLNSTATAILISTYLGGNSTDLPRHGAVDDSGNIYVAGLSYASDTFTTKYPGAIQGFDTTADTSNGDVYLVKLNEAIDTVMFTTYVGGSGYDDLYWFSFSVHPTNGRAALAGTTFSSDFVVTANAFDSTGDINNGDGFVTIIDTTQAGAASLIYSSYIGGTTNYEEGWSSVFDTGGNVYVTGDGCSSDFPGITAGAFDTTFDSAGCDGYLIRIDPTGNSVTSLSYGTAIGGAGYDVVYGVAMGPQGHVYICGSTNSSDFVRTAGAYDSTLNGSHDAFLYKMNPVGGGASDLVYGTTIGGTGSDWCGDLRVHTDGVAYFQGRGSAGYPTTADAFSATTNDLVVVKLNPAGGGSTDLIYSTYFGGTSAEQDWGIALDALGNLYITGNTASTNFPVTSGVFQGAKSTGTDGYFAKLALAPINTAPGAPTNLFSNNTTAQVGSTNPGALTDTTPAFSAICVDPDSGDIMDQYQIQVDNNDDFSSAVWDSGGAGTALTDCVAGSRSEDIHFGGAPLALDGTTYYWRIRFWDDSDVVGSWSEDPVSTNIFTMAITNVAPLAPTTLFASDTDAQFGSENPVGITAATPVFSAICNDSLGDIMDMYRVQVDESDDFSSILWDSGAAGTAMGGCVTGSRSENITYGGAALAEDETTYYWRIKFWDDEDTEGAFSEIVSTNTFTMALAVGGGGGSSLQLLQQQAALPVPSVSAVTVLGFDRVRFDWDYSGSNQTGFRILDEQAKVAVEILDAQARTATETGLPHNTLVAGRKVVAYNSTKQSDPSAAYSDVYTYTIPVTPVLGSRVEDRIRVHVNETVNNLVTGQSGIQFELMTVDDLVGSAVLQSDWLQMASYVFEGTNPDQSYYVRSRARNAVGVETAWSNNVLLEGGEELIADVEFLLSLSVHTADGRDANAEGSINPNELMYGEITIVNNGTQAAENAFVALPLPQYLTYVPGSLSVDGRRQSDAADGDVGQARNDVVAAIWPSLEFGFGHTIRFALAFDTPNLIEDFVQPLRSDVRDDLEDRLNQVPTEPITAPELKREDFIQLTPEQESLLRTTESLREVLAQAVAAAGPALTLQASASHEGDPEPVYSNPVSVEPELTVFIVQAPVAPEPVIIEDPVAPTPEEIGIIEEIFEEEFPQTQPTSPAGPVLQTGETTSSFDGGNFSVGFGGLSLTGTAVTKDDQIQFTGTTNQPFTLITLIFNDSTTTIVVSNADGQWSTFVSAETLGIAPGQKKNIRIEAIAAKGTLRSERVSVGDVTLTRGQTGDVVADFETIVSENTFVTALNAIRNETVRVIEEQAPAIQTTLTAAAPLIVVSSVPLWGYLPYIPTLIYHFITWLLSLLGRKRKDGKTYGVVYDSISKQILPLAIVRIYSLVIPTGAEESHPSQHKLVSTLVTDKLGRYESLLPPGNYRLEVSKPQYQFPSQIVTTTIDGNFDRVYQPGKGMDVQEQAISIPQVPVDPINVQRDWELSFGFRKVWLAVQRVGHYLATPLLVVGLLSSAALVYAVPDKVMNWVILGLYAVLLVSQVKFGAKAIKAWGVVYDLATNAVLPLTTIQLIDPSYNKVVTSRLTDYQGRFSFLPEPGSYVVKASKPGYEQVKEVVETKYAERQPMAEQVQIDKPDQRIAGDVAMKSSEA